MKSGILAGASLLLTLMSAAALAAGSAVVEGNDGTQRQRVSLEYSGDKLRMDMPQQANATLIVRDGTAYGIVAGMVLDLRTMLGMLAQRGLYPPTAGPDDLGRYRGLDDTGRRETVAGIEGAVYRLRYEDPQGQAHSEELVLSGDRRVSELTAAVDAIARRFRAMAGQAAIPDEAALRAAVQGQGVLRYGDAFRVISLGAAPAASRFEIPSPLWQLPAIGN